MKYPKRLIEVDLPIKRISAHARREKSIRHGHISTLHIWWARRPLAACRAVLCASLWIDPVDELCPDEFRQFAKEKMLKWATEKTNLMSGESLKNFQKIQKNPEIINNNLVLRNALLDFIADFSNWDNSTVKEYLDLSRELTQVAHESLGGIPETKPLVVDPFAGGGSIPLEALRVGADAFASDLNPLPVLLNKVNLEFIPKYGSSLYKEIKEIGELVKKESEKELNEFYPNNNLDNPIVAYLWARTINCEGPGCGLRIPLIRSLNLAQKGNKSVNLKLIKVNNNLKINIEHGEKINGGTVKKGSLICPICNYTTPVSNVRKQLKDEEGGANTSTLLAIVCRSKNGKTYREPSEQDLKIIEEINSKFKNKEIIPKIELPLMSGVFNVPIYGINRWDLLFSYRQLITADIISRNINKVFNSVDCDLETKKALKVILFLALGKYLDFRSTLCGWISKGEKIGHTFGRQALGMIFDWTEGVPFGDISGSWDRCISYILEYVENIDSLNLKEGNVEQSPAQNHPLPDDSVQIFFSDPPYYNAVPYADLSDFFYIWLKKGLSEDFHKLFENNTSPKDQEICEMSGWDSKRYANKDSKWYEEMMGKAMSESCRILTTDGIGVVVFAHKSTKGWEAQLKAMVDAGWIITASWAIDTERAGRLRAMNSAALASSVHLVCRKRENNNNVGDWRDVLQELPKRIHEWMPRLAEEGVVGADAIFACLGPALEIFSQYSSVEKANGEEVTLGEYLEQVWAAVAKEGLNMVFSGADTSAFEPDARLTAMWLWTIGASNDSDIAQDEESEDDEEESKTTVSGGFKLEYDAARKIAQGLGAHLEQLGNLIAVKGAEARLLPVSERATYLFGKDQGTNSEVKKKKVVKKQIDMFQTLEEAEIEEETKKDISGAFKAGKTILDKVHQSMILFAAGKGDTMKRFLVDEGVGSDERFWKLAQSLSALYPSGTDEKRWVDGVLARKKGLGF